ncbi:MAG: ABC transporter ATP-binding protein/permease, partial [Bacillales bacterium]|nr:ABC transporter ATP-binding protein/permease [Bacillales bacterium]
QRIAIARALYKKPEIIIFDDSFSALDFKTDKIIRGNIKEKYHDISNIIVGQRIGTIKECSQIIVIDEGEIVGIGKHLDLLKTCNLYKEIALTQLSEEELTYA